MLSKDPGNLFGYRGLEFDKDLQYDKLSFDESGVDARKGAKTSEGSTTSTQAKGPTGKTVTKVAISLTPGLLEKAWSLSKPAMPGRVPRTSPKTTAQTTVSTVKALSTTSSAKARPRVAKTSSPKGTAAKGTPTSARSLVPLPLATKTTVRKRSESETRDSSPGIAGSERTRKKTNANELTDDQWIVDTKKLAEVRDRLTHVQVNGEPKSQIEEMMEDYIAHCAKAIQTGKRDDLPKYLQMKLNDQKRERENEALTKAASPLKTRETLLTPTIMEASSSTTTTTVAKANVHREKGEGNAPKEKEKGTNKEKSIEEQSEIVAIESDVESDEELGSDEQTKGTTKSKAWTGLEVQSTSGNTSATPMDADRRIPMEVEQEEEEAEARVAMETTIAVVTTPTPTTAHTYSTTVSAPTPIPIRTTMGSLMPTPAPIFSTVRTTSTVHSTLVQICDASTNTLRYALRQGPHPTLLTEQTTLVQSRMSAQAPISSTMGSNTRNSISIWKSPRWIS